MISLRILTLIVLSLIVAACGGDDEEGKDTKVTTETTAGGEKTEGTSTSLKAVLSGTEEVPGPGVKDGVGAALIDIAGSKVCADLNVTMGEKPQKAHIHKGAKGASGPVVVDLVPVFNPGEAAFTSKSCVETAADTAAQLIADPGGYYVNVHSASHSDGAMRGQLAKV